MGDLFGGLLASFELSLEAEGKPRRHWTTTAALSVRSLTTFMPSAGSTM
jgi:hypothetical protein